MVLCARLRFLDVMTKNIFPKAKKNSRPKAFNKRSLHLHEAVLSE